MLSRALTASTRSAAAFTPTSSRVAFLSSSARRFAGQPDHNSTTKDGSPVTSTSHPTVPHAPPKPTPFFARKNIGLEVTPLMAFIATFVPVASLKRSGTLFDQGVQHRHGVDKDEALEKALAQPDPKPKKEEKKEGKEGKKD
ncbi:hypothetical protein JCM11251_007357 [Rhodosporidiobolus azoricus]